MAASPSNSDSPAHGPCQCRQGPPAGTWHITIDGQELTVNEGQTVAAALVGSGRRVFRFTARGHQPRGLFCGMGTCFDCLVQIDGRPNVRACQTYVRDGMRVTTQQGEGAWEPRS